MGSLSATSLAPTPYISKKSRTGLSVQSLAIELWDLSIMVHKKQADMGIPVNEKCTLVREGARDGAYLDDVVSLVLWTVVGRNFKSLAEVGQIEVGHFNGQGKVRDLLLGVDSELCWVKDNRLF